MEAECLVALMNAAAPSSRNECGSEYELRRDGGTKPETVIVGNATIEVVKRYVLIYSNKKLLQIQLKLYINLNTSRYSLNIIESIMRN